MTPERKISVAIFAVLGSILFPSTASANDSPWGLLAGVGMKQLSFDVYREGETDPEGTLISDMMIVPELSLERGFRPLAGKFGYKLAANLGLFSMNTQEVGVDLVEMDLGTSVKGFFLYAMPVLGYEAFTSASGSSFFIGGGVGLGYLSAEGNLRLTESPSNEMLNVNLSEFTYSYGVIAELVSKGWSFSLTCYGPEVTRDNYEYNFFDIGFSVRKVFSL